MTLSVFFDASPICDGAAGVVLAPREEARAYTSHPVHILASSVATDRFLVENRQDPLALEASHLSSQKAFRLANVNREDVSFFELHDAFSIMACLIFGSGWQYNAGRRVAIGCKKDLAKRKDTYFLSSQRNCITTDRTSGEEPDQKPENFIASKRGWPCFNGDYTRIGTD